MRAFSPASIAPIVLSLIALLALGMLAGCSSNDLDGAGVGEGEGEGEGEGGEGEGEGGEGEGEGGEGEGEGGEGEGEGIVTTPDVRLNEIDCRGQDHVEIVGPAGTDLTGLVLAEGLGDYTLPPGSIVGDNGVFVVDEEGAAEVDEETGATGAVVPGFPFEIECSDRLLTLSFDDGSGSALVDSTSLPPFPGSYEGTSWCRLPDANGDWALCTPTLGEPNAPYIDPDSILFDPLQVITVDIALSDAATSSLTTAPRTYVEGTVTVTGADGTVYGPTSAGVAIKGNEAGSFRPLSQKAAFKVKFNEFAPGNRLLGLKGFKLNNMVEDISYLHEAVGYQFFRQLGVPAARAGYARVLVNGNDYGLHALVERVDDIFASRHFAETQHIYEGGLFGVDAVPCTAECAASTTCFCVDDLEVDSGDELDRADVNALAAASVASGDAFFAGAQGLVDFETSARSWIAAQYLYHWDGYAGGRNNFYLHSDDDGVFTWIPSGMDQSLDPAAVGLDGAYDLKTGQTPFAGNAAQGTFFAKCRSAPACDALLDSAIDDVAAAVAAWDAVAYLDDVRAVIEPYVADDPRRPDTITLDEVHAAQDATRSLLQARVSVVQ
jgi:hypothetical protein